MPITFRCSDCTQKLRIEDSYAGKRVACVRCGSKQRVPLESSPEFSQAGTATPRKQPKPAATPPAPKPPAKVLRPPLPSDSAPKRPEPAAREPERRQPPKPAIPPAPIWFKSIGPAKGQPSPRESAPPETQPEIQLDIEPEIQPEIQREPQPELQPEPQLKFQPEREPLLDLKPLAEPMAELLADPVPAAEAASRSPWPEQQKFDADQTLLVRAPQEHPEPEEFGRSEPEPESEPAPQPLAVSPPMPLPRRRGASAARVEPSLVPPYKKLDVEEMIDMTAMVDIVFFLLIFFLVTSMHSLDSTIPMPVPDPQKGAAREPKSVAAIDSDDSYVVVRIDRNDKILIEGSEVRNDRELLFKLNELRHASARPEKLLVVGHGDATHGTVVMVLDAGRELGMDQVRLTMQDEPE